VDAFDRELRRRERERAKLTTRVQEALDTSPAIRVTYAHRVEMAILTREMSNPEEGRYRMSFFLQDGPRGHETSSDVRKLAGTVASGMISVEPMTDAEVIAWTSAPAYVHGAKAVAFTQADNEIRFLARRLGRYDEIKGALEEARSLFDRDPVEATAILHRAIGKLTEGARRVRAVRAVRAR